MGWFQAFTKEIVVIPNIHEKLVVWSSSVVSWVTSSIHSCGYNDVMNNFPTTITTIQVCKSCSFPMFLGFFLWQKTNLSRFSSSYIKGTWCFFCLNPNIPSLRKIHLTKLISKHTNLDLSVWGLNFGASSNAASSATTAGQQLLDAKEYKSWITTFSRRVGDTSTSLHHQPPAGFHHPSFLPVSDGGRCWTVRSGKRWGICLSFPWFLAGIRPKPGASCD